MPIDSAGNVQVDEPPGQPSRNTSAKRSNSRSKPLSVRVPCVAQHAQTTAMRNGEHRNDIVRHEDRQRVESPSGRP